jgi:dephospho-CoA kinase
LGWWYALKRVVGLTGGIGSGKSTVADLFRALGVHIVDTDAIAHQLSAPGGPGAAAVGALFGRDYLTDSGAIDRPRLRQLVFHHAEAKRQLDDALHPLIRDAATQAIAATPASAPYTLLVVPLLFETNAYQHLLYKTLVVDVAEDTQIARVMKRNGFTEDEVRAIMSHQLSRAERNARADNIITNDGEPGELLQPIQKLHELYLRPS